MGFFGTFVYGNGQWTEDVSTVRGSPSLRVEIHDSDFAQIDYAPADAGRGRFYLGFEPAIYFEDPSASQPVNAPAEAGGFCRWAEQATGAHVAATEVMPLLADPEGADPEDVFVEDTVLKLLQLAGLPSPPALRQES